jgi:6-phosphofructokinase
MDNDVFGTDYCLGFSTAITRENVESINACDGHRLTRADCRGGTVWAQLWRNCLRGRLFG